MVRLDVVILSNGITTQDGYPIPYYLGIPLA